MPKARSSKILKKEDFIYASNCTDRLLVSVSNSAVHKSGNGGSRTRAMSFESMRNRSPPKNRDDTQVFSFTNDLQTFFPREETQRQEYRTRNGKVIFRMISVFAWRRGFNASITESDKVSVGCIRFHFEDPQRQSHNV